MTEKRGWADIVGPCYTASSLAHTLGWTESEVSTAAASFVVLEVVTSDEVMLYPAFQVWEGHLVEGLGMVLRVLSTGTKSRWTWAQWLNTDVNDQSGKQAPRNIEKLRAGQLEAVLLDAHHVVWSWTR